MGEGRALLVLVLVLWLAVSVEVGWCLDAADVKEKAEDVKQTAAEAMQEAKDKGGSWAGWAYEKFSE